MAERALVGVRHLINVEPDPDWIAEDDPPPRPPQSD